ncbi:MAG: hypothetical protein AB7T63_03850 [Planctomycetota bacterium]
MKTTGAARILVAGALLVGAGAWAHAGDPPKAQPTDQYVKLLEGKRLVEGRGFEGVVEFGMSLAQVKERLGPGREPGQLWPGWHVYDKGPWKLSIIVRPDLERGRQLDRVEVMLLEGAKAPGTSCGVHIGDNIDKVAEAYGRSPVHFEGKIDNPDDKRMFFVFGSEDGEEVTDFPARIKFDMTVSMGNYYADRGVLVTLGDEGKVDRVIAFLKPDPVPIWLREQPDPPRPWLTVFQEGVAKPRFEQPDAEAEARGLLQLPPPPEVNPIMLSDLSLPIPLGWRDEGDVWVSPDGAERLSVEREVPEPGEAPAEWFDYVASFTTGILTDPAQRNVPEALLKEIGASAGRTYHFQAPVADGESCPLRTWVLLLAQGEQYWRISISRRVESDYPSPDGMELARRVFRGIRITP